MNSGPIDQNCALSGPCPIQHFRTQIAHACMPLVPGNFECSLSTLQNNRPLVAGYSGISQSLCLTLKCNDIIQSEHNFKPMQINTIIFINNLDVNECERFE